MQQRIKLIAVKSMLLFSLLFFVELNIASATLNCIPLGAGEKVNAETNMASVKEQVLRETEALYFGVRYSEVDAFKEDPSADKSLITTFVNKMNTAQGDIESIHKNLEDKIINWPDDYQNRKLSVEEIRGQLKTLLSNLDPLEKAVEDNINNISKYEMGIEKVGKCFEDMKTELAREIKQYETRLDILKNPDEITKKSIQSNIDLWKTVSGHVQTSEQSNVSQNEHMKNYMDKSKELLRNLKDVLQTFVARVNVVVTFLHIYSQGLLEVKHIPARSDLDANIGISANTLLDLGDLLLREPKDKDFNSSIQKQDYNVKGLHSYAAFSSEFHNLVTNWMKIQDVLQKIDRMVLHDFVGKEFKLKRRLTLHLGPAEDELNIRNYRVEEGEIFTIIEDSCDDGKSISMDSGTEVLCVLPPVLKNHFEEAN
jgi:hypothetical protein